MHSDAEKASRQKAIDRMVHEIGCILSDHSPTIYLYGSSAVNDFRPGWSDIDILVLTDHEITPEEAGALLPLRRTLHEKEPENPNYRLFEGGMLSKSAFLSKSPCRVVYWGTSGERIADHYAFDSFSTAQLLKSGVLLKGTDIKSAIAPPTEEELHADIRRHLKTIRDYAHLTKNSLYIFGWMLDIARCLYTFRTNGIISKTEAGEWALRQGLCPDPDALSCALKIRKQPFLIKTNPNLIGCAENMLFSIQRFADVLEREINK